MHIAGLVTANVETLPPDLQLTVLEAGDYPAACGIIECPREDWSRFSTAQLAGEHGSKDSVYVHH